MAAGDWGGARDAFSAVLEIAEVPEAFFGLANALFWLGDIAGTIAYCEKAYAGFRRRPDPLFAAGRSPSSGSRKDGWKMRHGCYVASRDVRKRPQRSPRCNWPGGSQLRRRRCCGAGWPRPVRTGSMSPR